MLLKIAVQRIAVTRGLVQRIALCLLAVGLCTQSGCITLSALMGQKRSPKIDTSLLAAQGYSIPPGGMPAPVAMDPSEGPRIVLEIRSGESQHIEKLPLPVDRGVFVDDLVKQTELNKQLGNLSISIMRPNGSGAPLRLTTTTDKHGRSKNMGQNYALLPGDHVIVYGDQRTLLERFIDDQVFAQ